MVDVKIILNNVELPSYANADDSGVDLYSKEDVVIPAGAKGFLVKTGIRVELEKGYELQIRPKSGNSIKTPIRVILGTVDSGYRGEIAVILDNLGNEDFKLSKDKAVAQAVLNYVPKIKFKIVEELSNTDRGQGGFGSSGRGL
jgi:dUTP pyrophosphatase